MQFVILMALGDCSNTSCYQYLSLAELTFCDFFFHSVYL